METFLLKSFLQMPYTKMETKKKQKNYIKKLLKFLEDKAFVNCLGWRILAE